MTSQATLNQEQLGPYYHGTSARFQEGQELRGPGQEGARSFDPPHATYDPDRVYYTTSQYQAESYAERAARVHGGSPTVYEVHPGEGHEKDPETAGVKGWDVSYRSRNPRVLREVGMRE